MGKATNGARKSKHARYIAWAGTLAIGLTAATGSNAEEMAEAKACYLAQNMEGGTSSAPSPEALDDAYDCFEEQLLAGYAKSKHVLARVFGDWDRSTYAPFQYDEIGSRYLVVYGNDRAVGEESTLWLDRDLPVGGTVAAAGFSISEDGKLIAEPLMIYEKMTQGYTFGRGNWRQTMIGPDGAIIGVTKGPGADALTVCQDCAAPSADRVYLALLNDGMMPANAPEPSAPITDNE